MNQVSMWERVGFISLSHLEQLQEDVLQDEAYRVLRERERIHKRKSG